MKRNSEARHYSNEPLQMGNGWRTFSRCPEDLVFRPKGVKVTITLSEESIDYFKEQGERLNTPYQRMIRNLIDEYVRHMRNQKLNGSV